MPHILKISRDKRTGKPMLSHYVLIKKDVFFSLFIIIIIIIIKEPMDNLAFHPN